jgi:hypothetical protein
MYPQSDLKGQHTFSRLLPAKKKKIEAEPQKEQLQLLRQILAELQTLNANLAAVRPSPQLAEASTPLDNDDDELEEYE